MKDEGVATNLNFNSNIWSDPYTIIIKLFLEDNAHDIPPIVYQLFTRKNLKKSIMTTNYNVSFFNFYKYFFNNLNYGEVLSDTQFKELIGFLRKFYLFILNDIFLIFFKDDRCSILQNLDPNAIIIGDITMDLSYLEILSKQTEVTKLNRKNLAKVSRLSLQKYILSDKIDLNRTKRALDPNLIQAYDAYLCHKTIGNTDVLFTIHDCFGFLTSDVGQILDYHNSYFNMSLNRFEKSEGKVLGDKSNWYSIFILL